MKLLGYAYRFLSNFVFLALVYYSLNLIEKYPQRVMLAVMILIYADEILTSRAFAAKHGDKVDANDVPFSTTFPYVALPRRGSTSVNSPSGS